MTTQLNHYRLLGRSGLRVSPLSLGTMTFGVDPNEWGTTPDDAAKMLDLYMDRGGNFIDSANFYGQMGGSEAMLGNLMHAKGADTRERLVVATKYSLTTRPHDVNNSGNHRKSMVRSVEDSLRRLKTDYIDLLYLHIWDFTTPVDEIMRAFDDLARAGKILYAGLSDIPAWQAARMQTLAELRGWTPIVALQISYSLLERTVERDLIPMAREMGMGVIPWSPLGGGVLTGKYSSADLAPSANPTFNRAKMNSNSGCLNAHNLAIADLVVEIAKELEHSPSQVALAWTLQNPAVISPIIGARNPAQLADNLGALDINFTPDQLSRLNAASAISMGFPHDMLAGANSGIYFGRAKVEPRN